MGKTEITGPCVRISLSEQVGVHMFKGRLSCRIPTQYPRGLTEARKHGYRNILCVYKSRQSDHYFVSRDGTLEIDEW